MNNIAIVENDIIVNVVVGDLAWAHEAFPEVEVLVCPEGAGIGWPRVNGVFVLPTPTPVAPVNTSRITRRQGLIALYTEQGIQEQDVQTVIDGIEDPSQRYIAQIEFASQYWEIDNPLIMQLAVALEITPERLQELFNIAATL